MNISWTITNFVTVGLISIATYAGVKFAAKYAGVDTSWL